MQDYYATFPSWERAGGGMGKGIKSSFETSMHTMIPLKPAKPVEHVSLCLSKAGDKHSEKENCVTTGVNSNVTDTGNKGVRDVEAAKAAVLFMDLPETLVQLVIDMEHLEPSLSFTNAEHLYKLVCELINNPERQAELVAKQHQHQQASKTSSNNVEESRNRDENGILSTCSSAEGDRQKLPTGMPEGSRLSASAASSSSSFTAAVASGCPPPVMVELPEATTSSEDVCKKNASGCFLPEMVEAPMATAAPCRDACKQMVGTPAKTPAELSLTSLTTSTKHPEENVDENLPKNTITSSNVEQPQADISKTSSKELLRRRVRRLAEENWRLTQRKLCRACKQVELSSSGVTFLPCGHFITCEECSEKFDDCPACGKVIMGTVRTFLA